MRISYIQFNKKMGLNKGEYKNFAIIIGDGSIRVRAKEGDIDAVLRKYKTKDGEEREKWETVYKTLDGLIEQIQIVDSPFGKNLQIKIDDIYLTIGVSSNFGSDIMKKLPNIDIGKKVEFCPYSFTDKTGKLRKGVTIIQEDKKIETFFYDIEKRKELHGFPVFPKDYKKFDSEDWKSYFIGVSKFLQKYTIDNVMPKIIEQTVGSKEVKTDELDVDNIPL